MLRGWRGIQSRTRPLDALEVEPRTRHPRAVRSADQLIVALARSRDVARPARTDVADAWIRRIIDAFCTSGTVQCHITHIHVVLGWTLDCCAVDMTVDPFAIHTARERPHAGPWQVSVAAIHNALVADAPWVWTITVMLCGWRRV